MLRIQFNSDMLVFKSRERDLIHKDKNNILIQDLKSLYQNNQDT